VTNTASSRIWFQGLVPLTGDSTAYYQARADHALAVSGPGTTVEFSHVDERVFGGLTPADLAGTPAGERLFEIIVADAAMTAETAGCDAVAVGVIQDSGVPLARAVTGVPVVGYGQASALLTRSLGRHLGVLAFNPPLFPLITRRLNEHVPGLVAGVEDLAVSYQDVLRSFSDDAAAAHLRDQVTRAAARLVGAGADVLVAGQMVLSEAVWHAGVREAGGAVLIDGLAATVGLAELMISLRRRTGLQPSRVTAQSRPAGPPLREWIRQCASSLERAGTELRGHSSIWAASQAHAVCSPGRYPLRHEPPQSEASVPGRACGPPGGAGPGNVRARQGHSAGRRLPCRARNHARPATPGRETQSASAHPHHTSAGGRSPVRLQHERRRASEGDRTPERIARPGRLPR
jgi:allantoin racemase